MATLEDLTKQVGLMSQLLTQLASEKTEKPAEKQEEVSNSKAPEGAKPKMNDEEKASISQLSNTDDSVVLLDGSFSNHRPALLIKREAESDSSDEEIQKPKRKFSRFSSSSEEEESANTKKEPEKVKI